MQGKGRDPVKEMDKSRARQKVLEETSQPLTSSLPGGLLTRGWGLRSPPNTHTFHPQLAPLPHACPQIRVEGSRGIPPPAFPGPPSDPGPNREGGHKRRGKGVGPTRGRLGDSPGSPKSPAAPPHRPARPDGGGVGREEGATSKPILISPIMSAGRRLEKASGTLNKKNVANAIIEGGSRRAGIASL